jgi:hypothetical protein
LQVLVSISTIEEIVSVDHTYDVWSDCEHSNATLSSKLLMSKKPVLGGSWLLWHWLWFLEKLNSFQFYKKNWNPGSSSSSGNQTWSCVTQSRTCG